MLFDLILRHLGRAVVRHSGGHHQGIRIHGVGLDSFKQFCRGGKRHHFNKRNRRQVGRCQQRHIRAAQHTGAGHGIAHFAGGMVCQVAHRVHRFAGAASGNHHFHALHVFFVFQLPCHIVHQNALIRQAAGARIAAGQQAGTGGNDGETVMFQRFQVILGDGVFQHMGVHGGGHQLGAAGRQGNGGQHVIRQAVGQLGDHICGCRGDQHQIRRVGQ